jgi:hypothetical protein
MTMSRNIQHIHQNSALPSLNNTPSVKMAIMGQHAKMHSGNSMNLSSGSFPNKNLNPLTVGKNRH